MKIVKMSDRAMEWLEGVLVDVLDGRESTYKEQHVVYCEIMCALSDPVDLPETIDFDNVVAKAAHLDNMISGEAFPENYGLIFGSLEYLTQELTNEVLNGNSTECDKFIEQNVYEQYEDIDAASVYTEMKALGEVHEADIRNLASKWDD